MSTTSRIGFLLPDVTDLADENIYYDPNILTFEAELPSPMVTSLPGSGNWTGRFRTMADTNSPTQWGNPAPNRNWIWGGSSWLSIGNSGSKTAQIADQTLTTGSTVSATGTEVFQSSPVPGLSQITVSPNSVLRFEVQSMVRYVGSAGAGDSYFDGKFNIFINPNGTSQPTPTTPGAIRLSFPIQFGESPSYVVSGTSPWQKIYGEMFYNALVNAQATYGAAAYLSCTNNSPNTSLEVYAETVANGTSTSRINIEKIGVQQW